MQGRQERGRLPREDGKRIIVEMKMEQIKLSRAPPNVLQHDHVQRHWVADRAVEPEGLLRHWLELGRGHGIAAGEERHLMAERHEFFGQPGNHALGPPIEFRRDCLRQRCNLGNTHRDTSVQIHFEWEERAGEIAVTLLVLRLALMSLAKTAYFGHRSRTRICHSSSDRDCPSFEHDHHVRFPPINTITTYASRPLAFFWRYIARHPFGHAAIFLSVLAAVGCSVSQQYGIKFLIDTLASGPAAHLWRAFVLLVALMVGDM